MFSSVNQAHLAERSSFARCCKWGQGGGGNTVPKGGIRGGRVGQVVPGMSGMVVDVHPVNMYVSHCPPSHGESNGLQVVLVFQWTEHCALSAADLLS